MQDRRFLLCLCCKLHIRCGAPKAGPEATPAHPPQASALPPHPLPLGAPRVQLPLRHPFLSLPIPAGAAPRRKTPPFPDQKAHLASEGGSPGQAGLLLEGSKVQRLCAPCQVLIFHTCPWQYLKAKQHLAFHFLSISHTFRSLVLVISFCSFMEIKFLSQTFMAIFFLCVYLDTLAVCLVSVVEPQHLPKSLFNHICLQRIDIPTE